MATISATSEFIQRYGKLCEERKQPAITAFRKAFTNRKSDQ
jgi:hypothetical protein